SPPSNVASFRAVLYLLQQEACQVLSDSRISSIGQAQFLKSDPTPPDRHFVTSHLREESFDQDAIELFAQQLRLNRAANQLASFAQQRDILLLALGMFEQMLFRGAALVPQDLQLIGIDAMAFGFEFLLQQSGERKVHVVAAQQDMLTNRNTLQRH